MTARRLAGLVGVALISLAGAIAPPLLAQETPEGKPFARTRLEPGRRVTVGQPVTVVVDVLVPNFFTGAPWFPSLDIDDAIAIYEDRGINFTEKIDGLTWSGQSRNYHVYPQRAGVFEIASIPVPVRYLSKDTGPRTRATVSPPPVRFEAVIPDEARGLPYFISTTDLKIVQSFDREPETLKVGDALTRTITVTVKDALSMVVPPIPSEPLPGLGAYAEPPLVRDEGGERGKQIVGTRVETTTFVAEKEGDYQLPAIELTWWDVRAGRLKTATAPSFEFHVDPDPELVVEIGLPPGDLDTTENDTAKSPGVLIVELLRRWGLPFTAAALTLILLSRLWWRHAHALSRRLVEARVKCRESEGAFFAAFRTAARRDDPLGAWNGLAAWLDRGLGGPGIATIRTFVDEAGNPELRAEVDALDATLFAESRGDRGDWSGRDLLRHVAHERRKRHRRRSGDGLGPLGPLNPGAWRRPVTPIVRVARKR